MSRQRPRATLDERTPDAPVRLEFSGATWHLTAAEAHAIQEEIGGVLMQLDPAPSSPPIRDEPPTRPGTGEARRRSSDRLAAVRLPPPGLDSRVAAHLAEGKGEPPASGGGGGDGKV